MDTTFMNPALAELAVSLATLAVKGTTTAVANKVKAIKAEKNVEVIRNTYDEIISELLSERDEAVRIAQSYKSELDRIEISEKDIEHLHNTVSRLIDILALFSSNEEDDESSSSMEGFQPFKELISADTLKTMQLLGFNYKSAIGDPLTQIVAEKIKAWGLPKKIPSNNNQKRK